MVRMNQRDSKMVPKAGLEPDIDVTPFHEILNFPIDMSTHNNP